MWKCGLETSLPCRSWMAAMYPAKPSVNTSPKARTKASLWSALASTGRATRNRSHTRPFFCCAASSAAFATSIFRSEQTRSRTIRLVAFGRVIYRKWAAVCPTLASRAFFSLFNEKVFTVWENEKSAINYFGSVRIKYILSVVRLPFFLTTRDFQ